MPHPNCLIIHGCPSQPGPPPTSTNNRYWIQWAEEALNAQGIPTETPLMPDPWTPDYERFKGELEKYTITEHTILIGHSCGCAFLVRWLGETKTKIAKLILVAPWKISPNDDPDRQAFYNYPIDETIKDRVGKIIMFTADNEESDGKESLQMFQEVLGGKVISLPGRGHYTIGDMGTEEFPELVQVVLD